MELLKLKNNYFRTPHPRKKKKKKTDSGLFFPSAAFGQFHAFQRLFFPFPFSLFRAISAQLYKEPFQKSFTLPHYVFQFHHTEAETERLWCRITKVQTDAPYEILASALPCSFSTFLWLPLERRSTKKWFELVWWGHRSEELVDCWSKLRGAGVTKLCLIGSSQSA